MKTLELKIPEFLELLEKLEEIKVNLQAENHKFQESEKWLDNEQVIKVLKISKRTLQNYRDRSILPFAQIGRKIYYKASDIQEYLDRHYIKSNIQKGGQPC